MLKHVKVRNLVFQHFTKSFITRWEHLASVRGKARVWHFRLTKQCSWMPHITGSANYCYSQKNPTHIVCCAFYTIRHYYVFSLHHTCFDFIKGGVKMKGSRKLASSSLCCTEASLDFSNSEQLKFCPASSNSTQALFQQHYCNSIYSKVHTCR